MKFIDYLIRAIVSLRSVFLKPVFLRSVILKSVLFGTTLLAQSAFANLQFTYTSQNLPSKQGYLGSEADDGADYNEPPRPAVSVSSTSIENNLTSRLQPSDLFINLLPTAKLEAPEPPSPLLFLVGIAIIGLVRLRNKVTR